MSLANQSEILTTLGWPEPKADQVHVLRLGTYHMDNPGLDEVNIEADDVLAPERQAELQDLANRLEQWNSDRIAVEQPHTQQLDLNSRYQEYRTRGLADRSEVVQIGFRLADRLDHE